MSITINSKPLKHLLFLSFLICQLLILSCGESGETKLKKGNDITGREVKGNDITGREVICNFKDVKYYAKVNTGEITLSSKGIPVFNGAIQGKLVVKNEPYEAWRTIKSVETNCRILDYDPPEFLVEGNIIYVESKAIFIAPGALIENATINRKSVPLNYRDDYLPYNLSYGEVVEIDSSGFIKSKKRQ